MYVSVEDRLRIPEHVAAGRMRVHQTGRGFWSSLAGHGSKFIGSLLEESDPNASAAFHAVGDAINSKKGPGEALAEGAKTLFKRSVNLRRLLGAEPEPEQEKEPIEGGESALAASKKAMADEVEKLVAERKDRPVVPKSDAADVVSTGASRSIEKAAPKLSSKNPFAADVEAVTTKNPFAEKKLSSKNPFAADVEAVTTKNPFAEKKLSKNNPFKDMSTYKADNETEKKMKENPFGSKAGSKNPFKNMSTYKADNETEKKMGENPFASSMDNPFVSKARRI